MTSLRNAQAILAVALLANQPAPGQNTAEPAPALRGMDVASDFPPSGPVKGQAAWRHDFDGARHLFASAQNKVALVADPDRCC